MVRDRPKFDGRIRRPHSEMTVVLETRVVTGTGGGPEKTILNSPRFLTSAGYRTVCAYMHPPGDPGFEVLHRKAEHLQAPLVSVPDRGPWDWQVVSRMLRICRRERVTIWHAHDYKSNALGLLLRRFWPMRLITTVHGWVQHTRRTPLYYWIDRVCHRRYECVICVSKDLHEKCLASGVPPQRCLLIENGIDTADYTRQASKAEAKARLGLPAERLVIGAVGRLSPEKGFDVLIRAAAELLKRGLDIHLLIAGEGDARLDLESLIKELNLGARVRLLGFRSDTRELYEALDVYALSSLREGLPNVVLEAMAMEAPVVATRIAGVPRLVQDGDNGLLVQPGDVQGLAEALSRVLTNNELATRLRTAALETIRTRFCFAARMDKIRKVYDDLLRTPPMNHMMYR